MAYRMRGRYLQRIRKRWFEQYPLCVECQKQGRVTLATELDHIIALTNGGKDFHEDSGTNRQGLCTDCHLRKSAKDKGITYKHRIGADGWPEE